MPVGANRVEIGTAKLQGLSILRTLPGSLGEISLHDTKGFHKPKWYRGLL